MKRAERRRQEKEAKASLERQVGDALRQLRKETADTATLMAAEDLAKMTPLEPKP